MSSSVRQYISQYLNLTFYRFIAGSPDRLTSLHTCLKVEHLTYIFRELVTQGLIILQG